MSLMYLCSTGFLPDSAEDSSLKYELDVAPELEQKVMEILGWKSLAAEADGEMPLTNEQVSRIAVAINESLPDTLICLLVLWHSVPDPGRSLSRIRAC
ncbi:pyocin S6 family toxin immunity protein [Pseudomonas sp. HLT2-19-2]